jgi:hypothetical protein
MFGLLVAEAEAAESRALIPVNALAKPEFKVVGSVALK